MNMRQCKNGHFYNADRNAACPYCNTGSDAPYTRPLNFDSQPRPMEAPAFPRTASRSPIVSSGQGAFPKTTASYNTAAESQAPFPKTMPLGNNSAVPSEAFPSTVPLKTPYNVTVAMHLNDNGIDPVRGWLVCVSGEKNGRDYRIHSDKNYIGRAKNNDICLDFDKTISSECHAILTHDPQSSKFWIQPGHSKNNIYLNDEVVLQPLELKAYDMITLGEAQYVFVPFCMDKIIPD